jgi:hypothetical protein
LETGGYPIVLKEERKMAGQRIGGAVVTAIVLLMAGCFEYLAPGGKIPWVTKEELRAMLGNPDLIVVDVRLEDEWKKSERKIKGAVREDPKRIRSWEDKYPADKTLVFYCD